MWQWKTYRCGADTPAGSVQRIRIRVTWPGLVRTVSFHPRSLASGSAAGPLKYGRGSGLAASGLAARAASSAAL